MLEIDRGIRHRQLESLQVRLRMAPVPGENDIGKHRVIANILNIEVVLVVVHEGREVAGPDRRCHRVIAHRFTQAIDRIAGKT